MTFIELFSWWYRRGWIDAGRRLGSRLEGVAHFFSVPSLTRTLFAPWRRIVTHPGAGLSAYMQALLDNLISRAVGFTTRLLVLATALILMALVTIASSIEILLWPLLPFAPVVCLVMGISNL
jgi:hypothetical protein